jgi:hypothetical protein
VKKCLKVKKEKRKGILECIKEMVRDRRKYKTGNFRNVSLLSAY